MSSVVARYYYQGINPPEQEVPIRNMKVPVAFPKGTTVSTLLSKGLSLNDVSMPTMWSPYAFHMDGSIAWARGDVRSPMAQFRSAPSGDIKLIDSTATIDIPALHPNIYSSIFGDEIWLVVKEQGQPAASARLMPVPAPGANPGVSQSYLQFQSILTLGHIGFACYWEFMHNEPFYRLTISMYNGWDHYHLPGATHSIVIESIQLCYKTQEISCRKGPLHGVRQSGSPLVPGCVGLELFPNNDKIGLGQGHTFDFVVIPRETTLNSPQRGEAQTEVVNPLRVIPVEDHVARCEAWSALGFCNVSHASAATKSALVSEANGYFGQNWFGFYGGTDPNSYFFWGDVRYPPTTGTPRNSLAGSYWGKRTLWAQSTTCLDVVECISRAQSLRPFLRGISPNGRTYVWAGDIHWTSQDKHGMPSTMPYPLPEDYHGIGAWSYEHMTVDMLYDHYLLSGGDPVARFELEAMGRQIECAYTQGYYLDLGNGISERGEGWMLYALANIYRATGKQSLKDLAIRISAKLRAKITQFAAMAMPQYGNANGVWQTNHWWSAPWQAGFLIYGLGAWASSIPDAKFCMLEVFKGTILNGWEWTLDRMKFVYDVQTPTDWPTSHGLDGVDLFIISAVIMCKDDPSISTDVKTKAEHILSKLTAGVNITTKWAEMATSQIPV